VTNQKEVVNTSTEHRIVNSLTSYLAGETLDWVEAAVRSKGMVIFLRLDKRWEAKKWG
jgi:hypothetical protein